MTDDNDFIPTVTRKEVLSYLAVLALLGLFGFLAGAGWL